MPIVNGTYKNPGWVNNQQPAINAAELNAISDTLEELAAGGGTNSVISFNGRTGAVAPQSGDYTAAMVGARPSTWTPSAADVGGVPTSRTINGKPLTSNITLTATDVGARPNTWLPTAADVAAVPTTRTVNGKSLASDITLTASDVGSAPITYGTADLTAGISSLATGTIYLVYE